jgi:hypothetical protein
VDEIKALLVMASLATGVNLAVVWGVLGERMGLDLTVWIFVFLLRRLYSYPNINNMLLC